MDKEKIKQFIISQRQNGVPDDQIHAFLVEKGAIQLPTQPAPQQETFAEKVAGFTGGKTIAQGLGQAIANPEIAKGLEQAQTIAMDTQSKLIQTIKDKKALGQDTTRLEGALADINSTIQNTANLTPELLNQKNITAKQVLGDALQLGTTIASVGSYGKGFVSGGTGTLKGSLTNTGLQKAAPSVIGKVTEATTIGQGIKQGAIAGAKVGSVYGASSGVSGALKEDKNLGEIAQAGLGGAIQGGATGAVLGGVIGGVTGGIKGRAIAKANKETNFAQDLVSPKATEEIKRQALREGRVTEQGLLNASKITPSKRDLSLADAVSDVVSSKNTPIKNIDAISSKVQEINMGVKAYVAENKVPFNTNQLASKLNKGKDELKLIFASDKNAEKTYNAVVKEFTKHVKSKDTSGLLDARQAFDKIPAIRKLLESQGLGENVKREIVLTARTKANEYIASLLPKGNKFRETLLKESKMIEAIGNIVDKATGQINKNKLQVLTEKYPILKYWTSLAIGAGGVGVGSVIIGSSD